MGRIKADLFRFYFMIQLLRPCIPDPVFPRDIHKRSAALVAEQHDPVEALVVPDCTVGKGPPYFFLLVL